VVPIVRRLPLAAATAAATIVLAVGGGPVAAPATAPPNDDDQEPPAAALNPEPERAPRTLVAFDRAWLEPFFTGRAAREAVERFRAEDWAGAEAGLSRAIRSMPRKSDERPAAKYLLGLTRATQQEWAEAGSLFEELYASYPKLAPYHAYNAARCRLRAGDDAGALEWAGKVPKGSVPEADAELVRIDALRSLARWDEALSAMDAYLGEFPNGPRHAEVLYKKADAIEHAQPAADGGRARTNEVSAIYRRVWTEAPLDGWGDRAAERLDQIASGSPPADAAAIRARTAGELVARGNVYFDRNRNSDSETTFAAALAAPGLDADLECKARFLRAQSVWKQRQRPRAAPLFDEAEAACARAGNRDLHAKALYQGARSYAAAGNRDAALARYARIEAEHADHSYADDARLRMAELASDAGDEDGAAKILAEVPARYPSGDLVNEALWRLAFGAWHAGRLDDTSHWLDENLRFVPHEDIWYAEGRVQYWKARVFEKQGRADDARTWYTRAVEEYPLSVYALLALARMKALDPHAEAALVEKLRQHIHHVPPWTFPPRALYGDPGFLRAVELARMGQGGDARRELARLGLATSVDKHAPDRARDEDESLIWITSILLDRGGLWSASHSLPRYGATSYRLEYPHGIGEAKWKLAYPRAFPALVAKNTRANDIPEALELAIMREESAFSPRIESFANAIGLTQMLVKTAKRFSNGAPVTRDVLLDPARNVELGARFLGFLWKHFNGAAPLSIAGYNAGEAAVDRWLQDRGGLDMDEFIETIPYDETRNYTKRVLASYFAYSWLYGSKPVPPVPLHARVEAKPATPEHARTDADRARRRISGATRAAGG
jgi:peptidoglycan lytic transglycosylase